MEPATNDNSATPPPPPQNKKKTQAWQVKKRSLKAFVALRQRLRGARRPSGDESRDRKGLIKISALRGKTSLSEEEKMLISG